MSFKRESMPSINESDNEEEESLSFSEDISTSDYASLNRQKNATLTKAINESICMEVELERASTLKQDVSLTLSDEHITNAIHQIDTDVSNHFIEDDQEEDIDKPDSDMNNVHHVVPIDVIKLENGNKEVSNFPEYSETDRFGFLKGSQYTDPDSEYCDSIGVIRTRERKWQEMINRWQEYKTKKRKKLVNRCRKGIPQSMRCRVWQLLCNSRSLETVVQERTYYKDQLKVSKKKDLSRLSFRNSTQAVNNSDNDSISLSSFYSTVGTSIRLDSFGLPSTSHYHDLFENYKKCTPNGDIVEQIRKDIHRQFPNHETFMKKGGLGQESLSTILTVYSIRHPETGYCQGMAPLAAALLMIMPEEDAFWTFDKICDSYIPGYYDEGLKQIQIDAKALNALLKKESSTVFQYMSCNQIDPICYMIDWFMCIFIRTLPWPSVLLVMDMFLCEGKSILFKVALVLVIGAMLLHKQNSKDSQDNEILTALRNLPESITTPKYIITHIAKLTVTKTDIKRECQNQEALMLKAMMGKKSFSK